MITLSEAYRKLNNKNTRRRRVNEAMQSDIPAPFNKYFKISDYEPDEGEYQIGERVDDYEIAAYLEPKDQYDGVIELFPFLLKGKEGFIVGDVSADRVYYIDADAFVEEATNDYREYMRVRKNQGKNDKVGSLKYESRRRPARRRRVNEAKIKVNDNMIPATLRQYFTISDYEPQLGEYQIGDVVDQNEVLAYLEPTPEYKDTIQIFPLLLKPILPPHARRGVYSTHPFVANVIHDRVYYVTDDDIHAELGESIRRPARRR